MPRRWYFYSMGLRIRHPAPIGQNQKIQSDFEPPKIWSIKILNRFSKFTNPSQSHFPRCSPSICTFEKHSKWNLIFRKISKVPTPKNSLKVCGSRRDEGFESFLFPPWFEILKILLWSIHDAFGNSKSRREPFHRGEEELDDFSFEAAFGWQCLPPDNISILVYPQLFQRWSANKNRLMAATSKNPIHFDGLFFNTQKIKLPTNPDQYCIQRRITSGSWDSPPSKKHGPYLSLFSDFSPQKFFYSEGLIIAHWSEILWCPIKSFWSRTSKNKNPQT